MTRWGILGTGRMAAAFAADAVHAQDSTVVAVGSRTSASAASFADRFAIAHPHGSYADLLADPEVDAVYLATPHPQHHLLALQTIAAGRAVLVEKSFTVTLAAAEEVVEAARTAGVFCMEAMWTRFQPAVVEAARLIETGEIGEVRAVQADLGAHRPFDPTDRLFDPALGGGAILDLGVYPVHLATQFLGAPRLVAAVGSRYPNGVDGTVSLTLDHGSGRSSSLICSLESQTPGRATILGTRGTIELEPRFHHPTDLVLRRHGDDPVRMHLPPPGRGYSLEMDEVSRCLAAGLTESPAMPLADTLTVQAVLQEALDQLGIGLTDATSLD